MIQSVESRPVSSADAPLIVHIIYRLDVGGLENGLVNLINHLPADRFRHAIVCITDYSEFRSRIQRDDVEVYALHKRDGHDPGMFLRLRRLLRQLRPAIVHTRNLAALECQPLVWLCGVPARVHGEHGWDSFDPHGMNRRYRWLRRIVGVFVQRFVPLSRELEAYLVATVGISPAKVTRIYNGVDTLRFFPRKEERCGFSFAAGIPDDAMIVGAVGRMHGVKDQITLVRAFIAARKDSEDARRRLRLVLVGDGPLRAQALELLADAGAMDAAWLPGARDDVPEILRSLDVYVLPSTAEGISNTILEAMASGLPVVATRVGGNPELVIDGETGRLVPAADPARMASALLDYLQAPQLARQQGLAGRQRVETDFSLAHMVGCYGELYAQMIPAAIAVRG